MEQKTAQEIWGSFLELAGLDQAVGDQLPPPFPEAAS